MTKFNVVTSSGLNIKNVADTLNGASGKDLANYITDIVYKLPSTAWDKSVDGSIFQQFSSLTDQINSTMHDMNHLITFWGLIFRIPRGQL